MIFETVTKALAGLKECSFPDAEFPVLDFGARGDGTSDDRPALQSAIEACYAAGGGRVVVPAGRYFLRGPIEMRSNVDLHLAAGSLLLFSPEPADYLPVVLTHWEGVECYNYSPLIRAHGAHNLAITGAGTIDGQGGVIFADWWKLHIPDRLKLRAMGREARPVEERVFGAGHHMRPDLLQFIDCERVLIEGVTFLNSPFWVVHPVLCRDLVIRGIRVDSRVINNDGIDVESCRRVLIEDCHFNTGDDAIAIKAGRDRDAWRRGVPSEEILVRNCDFEHAHNGIAVGSEMSGGVRNVLVTNCRVGWSRNVLFVKCNLDRGGFIENIRMEDIEVVTASECLIRIMTDYAGYEGGRHPPRLEGFEFSRVHCRQVERVAVSLTCDPSAPVRRVSLEDVEVERAAFPLNLMPGVEAVFSRVRVNGQNLAAEPTACLERPAD